MLAGWSLTGSSLPLAGCQLAGWQVAIGAIAAACRLRAVACELPQRMRYHQSSTYLERGVSAPRAGRMAPAAGAPSALGNQYYIEEELMIDRIVDLLGSEATTLLEHQSKTISTDQLNVPGPDFIDRVWAHSDRSIPVLRNLQSLFGTGRLANTGYLSILPVDQGIEHSAGASFAPNPQYFDPENIVKLALEGGCNAVASTYGVLGAVSRKYAHKIPFLVKINHNEFLTYPNKFDQIMFGQVKQAKDMGAVAVGATIYFGSDASSRQIIEVSQAFHAAHEMGLLAPVRSAVLEGRIPAHLRTSDWFSFSVRARVIIYAKGAVNPDEFYVYKTTLKAGKRAVIRRNLGSKLIQMVFTEPAEKAASGKLIAQRLNISENTLRNHLNSIYAKLGLSSRLELFAYAKLHSISGKT